METVGDREVTLTGIQRTVTCDDQQTITWKTYFTPDRCVLTCTCLVHVYSAALRREEASIWRQSEGRGNLLIVRNYVSYTIQYNTIQYETCNAPYVTRMLFVGAGMDDTWLGSIGNVEKMSLKFTFKNINRVASSNVVAAAVFETTRRWNSSHVADRQQVLRGVYSWLSPAELLQKKLVRSCI